MLKGITEPGVTLLVEFTVPGLPRPKGRPRASAHHGHVRMHTDRKTEVYEALVAMSAREARWGGEPFDCPILVTVDFYLPRPKSRPKKCRWPDRRPDLDNLVKAVLDGIEQAGIWRDDSRVVELRAVKHYGAPCAKVALFEINRPPSDVPLRVHQGGADAQEAKRQSPADF